MTTELTDDLEFIEWGFGVGGGFERERGGGTLALKVSRRDGRPFARGTCASGPVRSCARTACPVWSPGSTWTTRAAPRSRDCPRTATRSPGSSGILPVEGVADVIGGGRVTLELREPVGGSLEGERGGRERETASRTPRSGSTGRASTSGGRRNGSTPSSARRPPAVREGPGGRLRGGGHVGALDGVADVHPSDGGSAKVRVVVERPEARWGPGGRGAGATRPPRPILTRSESGSAGSGTGDEGCTGSSGSSSLSWAPA